MNALVHRWIVPSLEHTYLSGKKTTVFKKFLTVNCRDFETHIFWYFDFLIPVEMFRHGHWKLLIFVLKIWENKHHLQIYIVSVPLSIIWIEDPNWMFIYSFCVYHIWCSWGLYSGVRRKCIQLGKKKCTLEKMYPRPRVRFLL